MIPHGGKKFHKKTKPVKSLCEYQAITSLVPFYPQVLHLNCQMYYRSWSKRSSPFDSMAPGPKFIGAWWVKHPSEVEDVFSFTPFFVITRMDVLKNTSGILWLYSISVFQFPRVMFFSMTCKQPLPVAAPSSSTSFHELQCCYRFTVGLQATKPQCKNRNSSNWKVFPPGCWLFFFRHAAWMLTEKSTSPRNSQS